MTSPKHEPPDDLARALRFVHLVETQSQARIADLNATVYALVETLIADNKLDVERYQQRRHLKVLKEQERDKELAGVTLTDCPDKYALAQLPEIDCQALLPLCKARCCTMAFPLSVQDLDERVVSWDYGRPYVIARGADGYCTHHDGRGCGVYDQRPAVCRTYDCRGDKRVWLDFDKRIPAPPP